MNRPPLLLYVLAIALGALVAASVLWLRAPHGAGPVGPRGVAQVPSPPPRERAEGVVFSTTRQEPPTTPDLLPAGASAIYASYNLPELALSPIVEAGWTQDGKRLAKISAADIQPDAQSPGRGTIILRPAGGTLQPGIYELDIRTQRRRFKASFVVAAQADTIVGQQAPAEAQLAISQQTVARGVGGKGEPLQPTKQIGTRDKVYFVFRYEGAEPGMGVTIKWWGGTTEIKNARREVTLASTAGWAHAWMQAAEGLPPGTYKVTLTTSGDAAELARTEFAVQ